jgi:PAS domain S-box-containing protein
MKYQPPEGRRSDPAAHRFAEDRARAIEAGATAPIEQAEAKRLLHELRLHQIELEAQNRELQRTQKSFAATRARLLDLYDFAPVGCLTLDNQGRILEANLTAAALVGVKREALLGEPISRFVPPEQRDVFALECRALGTSASPREWEMPMVTADKTAFAALLRAIRTPLDERWIAITDVSERKRAAEDLLRAKQAAAAATVAKSEFLANMSHEIRTPINGVLGMLSLLLDSDLTEKQRHHVEIARGAGRGLLKVIDAILDLSNIEANNVELELSTFNLSGCLQGTIELLAIRAAEKGGTVAARVDGMVPRLVVGDEGRLRQILVNLIGNALKFSARGSAALNVNVDSGDERTTTLRFAVRDDGPGLAAAQMARIFEPFVQADGSSTREFGGTGLGLSISKQLVHLMGGTIGVQSAAGRGSTFWFTAVFGKATGEETRSASAERRVFVPAAVAGGGRLLLAEDDPTNQIVTRAMLERLGYAVDVVSNGREAVAALEKANYALVLMDCMMPELDGLGATAVIRDRRSAVLQHDIPIVALTANSTREDRARCRAAGMNDHLAKPVELAQLGLFLEKWLPPTGSKG